MESRHRETFRQLAFGSVTYPGGSGPQVGGPIQVKTFEQVTDDWYRKKARKYDLTGVGLPPSPFFSEVHHRRWEPITTVVATTGFAFHGWPPSYINTPLPHYVPPAGTILMNDEYAVRLIARTNPMRPTFSVPVALKELVEIVTLLSGINPRSFLSYTGSAYLTYKFGWQQLVRDVKTLDEIIESITSRVREYNSLIKRGGLRRKIGLDSWSRTNSGTDFVINSTYGSNILSNWRKTTKIKVWGSLHWYPTDITQIPTDSVSQWRLAVKQVLDLEGIDQETAWNLVPWTWLIDYFTNIGEVFAATEGRSAVVPRDVCIMKRTDTIEVGVRSPNTHPSRTGGGYRYRRTKLERFVVNNPSLAPTALTELLNFSQWKVVVALLASWR